MNVWFCLNNMKILDIYQKYKNMPQQAEHQLKVAAVADLICDHIRGKTRNLARKNAEKNLQVDCDNIVKACLLHDLGNIVKFDLNQSSELYPELFVRPEDRAYWEKVKQEFVAKYGNGSHKATMLIIGELGVEGRIRELVDCVGFDQADDNAATRDLGKKICAYSDMRIAPFGVSGLEERMADLRVRYQNHPEGTKKRDVFEQSLREIERQLFARLDIKPEDITEEAIAERRKKLKNFGI